MGPNLRAGLIVAFILGAFVMGARVGYDCGVDVRRKDDDDLKQRLAQSMRTLLIQKDADESELARLRQLAAADHAGGGSAPTRLVPPQP